MANIYDVFDFKTSVVSYYTTILNYRHLYGKDSMKKS